MLEASESYEGAGEIFDDDGDDENEFWKQLPAWEDGNAPSSNDDDEERCFKTSLLTYPIYFI